MKIVVTGALGHIGSRFIRDFALAFPGSTLVLLDNLSTQRYCSLFGLPSTARYEFIEADIRDYNFSALLSPGDVVVHLAAKTHPEESFNEEREVDAVNFGGTERVAQACLRNGAFLIFPSTTSVARLKSPYAVSKVKAEQQLNKMGLSGLDFIILRLGTIFGYSPGMRFHTAVNRFCWQAVTGQPLTVWRHALDQVRPYLSLNDAVRAILFFIEKNCFDRKTYSVVTTHAKVRQLLEILSRHLGDIPYTTIDSPFDDEGSYEVSSQDLSKLGFRFQDSLETGIEEILRKFGGLHKATDHAYSMATRL